MGIILKQTIRGSFWSYLGIALGFVTTTYLYSEYLTPEIVGLFGLLIAISAITSQFASLGFNGVTSRLFPYFRSKENKHNGFLFVGLLVNLAGFVLFIIFYFIFKEMMIEKNLEKSRLFSEYIYLLVPLTFFTMLFSFLDTFIKLLYNAVLGTLLQEFIQRILIFLSVILYALRMINLELLIISFATSVCLKGIIILFFLLLKKELSIIPKPGFIKPALRKEIVDVALFSIIGGLGSMIVFNVDKIIINQIINLSETGVYTIAFYFGTLVVIPSRPLLKIAGTLIAEGWAKNEIGLIKEIYYKSCINQYIIGGFLFLGLWANIDNIIFILGDDYIQSKWVIFFIGVGYLFDMMTGANGLVIGYSKYYRVTLYFIIILVIIVIILLYILIPIWGIVGAALAIALALLLNNMMRFYFLYKKYKMQPFNIKFFWVGLYYTALYFALKMIPQQTLIIDIIVRSSIVVTGTALFIYFFPISEDIKNLKEKALKYIFNRNN